VSVRSDLAPVTELADGLEGALLRELLNVAAYDVKTRALAVATAGTGGDRRLSRFGTRRSRGRTRMNAGYDTAGTSTVVNLRPAAMWALTDAGARPHTIGAGRRTRKGSYTRGRTGAVYFAFSDAQRAPGRNRPTRVRSGPIRHPGARGRRTLARLHADVPTIVQTAVTEGLQSYANTGRVR
jgi:hypothetical protein